ncbi:hypothetical protein [Streptomyces sp. NPDC059874]|uniref:hypothetical protein n=1 Tax=Streptomyces sp. NPDC059874 TaxID=3346983 RepID=UPI003660E7CA
MIGEPELDGEWRGAGHPAEEAVAPEPLPRRPRPWLWALGGAVVASAVWAGVPAAQDRFTTAPRISYRHSEDLCREAPLAMLAKVTGPLAQREPRHAESPALDWATCEFNGEWSGPREPDGKLAYYGQVQVELHKKSDPGPEFGAGLDRDLLLGPEIDEVAEIPELGERALLHGYMRASRLQVLDGGVVLTITVNWMGDEGGADADTDALASAAIEDMRALLVALKKK